MPTSSCPARRLAPHPPLDRVTLAARQPDPAWTQQVPPGPDGRQRHLSAVWDMVLEPRGVQGTFRISFPCPTLKVGVGVAQLVAGRHGHHHLARRMPRGGAGLAACRTSKAPQPLTAHNPGLARRPSTTGACGLVATGAFGGSACSSGNRGRGLKLRLAWCRISGDQAVNGTCRCGEVCKAQIEKRGVHTRQCKSKRCKLDEIHRKSYEIRTKFVRISYECRRNFTFPKYSHKCIHVKLVRNSYEIPLNFVRISYEFHVNFVQCQ